MNDAKTELGRKILKIKKAKGLKWGDIAARITMSPVWTCALCMGQMSAEPQHARGIAEMLELANEIREAKRRGDALGLSPDEVAFYDALGGDETPEDVMTRPVLCDLSRALVKSIRDSVTVDWTQKETVRAEIRTRIKRLLREAYRLQKEALRNGLNEKNWSGHVFFLYTDKVLPDFKTIEAAVDKCLRHLQRKAHETTT